MGNAVKTGTLAERMCFAYYRECERLRDEADPPIEQPVFAKLPDKGAAWWAAANARDQILATPKVIDPYEYKFGTPIPERRMADGEVVIEQLPTSVTIRPLVAGDLCVHL